jgi:hypothetical protein
MEYPKVHRIRQIFDSPRVENVEEAMSQELGPLSFDDDRNLGPVSNTPLKGEFI